MLSVATLLVILPDSKLHAFWLLLNPDHLPCGGICASQQLSLCSTYPTTKLLCFGCNPLAPSSNIDCSIALDKRIVFDCPCEQVTLQL